MSNAANRVCHDKALFDFNLNELLIRFQKKSNQKNVALCITSDSGLTPGSCHLLSHSYKYELCCFNVAFNASPSGAVTPKGGSLANRAKYFTLNIFKVNSVFQN